MSDRIKTMKNVIIAIAGTCSIVPIDAAEYEIEPVGSYVIFNITHFKVGKAYGRFNDFSGTVNYDPEKVESSKLEFRIEAASVDTGNKKRDAHLRNKDFFDAVQFPEISFKSKAIQNGTVTGNLKMLGVTKEISAPFKVAGIGQHFGNKRPLLGATAMFTIKRSDFGMKFGLPDALSDEVNITVSIEGLGK